MGFQKLLAWFHGNCSLIPRDWRFHQDAAPRGRELDFALLLKYGNWANRNHLISKSRALYKSFLSAERAHVHTRWHMWFTRLATVGVSDVSQAERLRRKEGRRDEDGVRQTQQKGGDLENSKVEGGAVVCDEKRREGRKGGRERGRGCPSLLISHINPAAVMCT